MSGFRTWLEEGSLGKHFSVLSENSIDLDIVVELNEGDLAELGLSLGDRKRMMRAISALRAAQTAPLDANTSPTGTDLQTRELPISDDVAERRQLTLMFVDLVGSTALSDTLDVEDYRSLLNDYQDCCQKVIKGNLGHVAQFVGDGIVAYFGYPNVEENDAERAVATALDIQSAIAGMKTKGNRSVSVRIGISSGDVVVDDGSQLGELAFGDVPNMAARIQALAEPGGVAISDSTKHLLGKNVFCKWMGLHELKGFQRPIGIWRVTGVDGNTLRFLARNTASDAPMIGREDELSLLEGRWQAARGGSGQTILLSGEAGIGKSRLVEALSDRIKADRCLRLSLQCSPLHDASAYYPIINFVNHMAGIVRNDGPDEKLRKLKRLLSNRSSDERSTLSVFARLMELPLPDYDASTVSPDELKQSLRRILFESIERLSRRRPILLLIEDLHWIDPSTEELIDMLIEQLKSSPVLIVCTFRPSYRPRWPGLAGVTSLTLASLDERATHQMIANLLDDKSVPPNIIAQIASKTEGVPLFVEEMARMVGGRIEQAETPLQADDTLTLPSTLKELLQSMFDKMSSARSLLPICAAIGNGIFPAMVEAVANQSATATATSLERLVDAQILVARGNHANRVYRFRHALIRDAAYDIMLPSKARALHRRISAVMSDSFSDLAKAHPELLAWHYSRADLSVEARDAWHKAAVVSANRSAAEETIQHLNAALRENEKIEPSPSRDDAEIKLRKLMNVALDTRAFGAPEVQENFTRLLELIDRADSDGLDMFLAIHVQFGAQLMRSDPQSAMPLCDEMNALANRTGDPTMAAIALHNVGMCRFMLGDLDAAIAAFERALVARTCITVDAVLAYHASDIEIVDMAMRCWAIALRDGDRADSRRELDAAVMASKSEAHAFTRCFALNILATAFQFLGDDQSVLDLVDAALPFSRKHEFQYWCAWSEILRGWAKAQRGDPSGVEELDTGIANYLDTGSTQFALYARTLLADACLALGHIGRGLAEIAQVRDEESSGTVRYQIPVTDRVEKALHEAQAAASSTTDPSD